MQTFEHLNAPVHLKWINRHDKSVKIIGPYRNVKKIYPTYLCYIQWIIEEITIQ